MKLLTKEQARQIKGKEIKFFAYSKNNKHSFSGFCTITSVTNDGLITIGNELFQSIPINCSLSGKVVYNYNSNSQPIYYKLN
jgi:hypothetical protein